MLMKLKRHLRLQYLIEHGLILENINTNDTKHQDALWEFNSEPLYKALDQAIAYFESTEQYERCAKLVQIKEMKKALEKDVPL